jgi:hypothetical protein
MNLQAEFFLNLFTNGSRDVLCEFLVDLFLVVIDGNKGCHQMLDVDQHVEGVAQRHEEVVQLIQPHLVVRYALEEHGKEGSAPVEEAAAGGLADIEFPVGYHVDLPGEDFEVDLG